MTSAKNFGELRVSPPVLSVPARAFACAPDAWRRPISLYVQRSPENRVQGRNHAIYVAVKIPASVHWGSVDKRKIPKTFGKLLSFGHGRFSDQYWNGGNALT